MRHSFAFANLCGQVYRQGNILFTRDGNTLISPVGNRVMLLDLVASRMTTLPLQARRDIACVALSPDGALLAVVDVEGYALLASLPGRAVIHHINFKSAVQCIEFSPDGKFLLVAAGRLLQVWATPVLERTFTPFSMHHTHAAHTDDITCLQWSRDSQYFVSGSKDLTVRIFRLHAAVGFVPAALAGHRGHLRGVFFDNARRELLTITADGAIFTWKRIEQSAAAVAAVAKGKRKQAAEAALATSGHTDAVVERWELESKELVDRKYGPVTSVGSVLRAEEAETGTQRRLLALGFETGVIALYAMPGLEVVQTLSISDQHVGACALNPSGEWIAFGCAGRGQLVVWEWASETYVLKQQGHFEAEVNALAFTEGGSVIATAGSDSKLKLWDARSGFCFATFTEHTAPITGVAPVAHGRAFVSCSLDGTARAFDIVRYRNFQTFVTPAPAQLTCVAVDASGELVAAGTLDALVVYVWSMQNAQVLESLGGHSRPISSVRFGGKASSILASASWDGVVRLWDVVGRNMRPETLKHGADVLATAFSPDGVTLVASSLDGQLSFWDVEMGEQVGTIDGRKDIAGGRTLSAAGMAVPVGSTSPCFRALSFSPDGEVLIAAGHSKFVCMYDARRYTLLKRFQLTQNRSLDGVMDWLDSRRLVDGVALDAIDDEEVDGQDWNLPGVKTGPNSKRRVPRAIRVTDIDFGAGGHMWAAATTEGIAVYTLDEVSLFDPTALDRNITPDAVGAAIADKQYSRALIMALRLNEEKVPPPGLRWVPPLPPPLGVTHPLSHLAAPRAHL